MMSKGIGFRSGTFACLLIVVISSELLRADGIFNEYEKNLHARMWDGEILPLGELNHEEVGGITAKHILEHYSNKDEAICGTTPAELLIFSRTYCDASSMGPDYFYSPAEESCCTPRQKLAGNWNHGVCNYLESYVLFSRARCAKHLFNLVFNAVRGASRMSDVERVYERSLRNGGKSVYADKEFFPACANLIEKIAPVMPFYEVDGLSDDFKPLKIWSNDLYFCKQHMAAYCSDELENLRQKCSDASGSGSSMPECAKLDEHSEKCNEISDLIVPTKPQSE